MGSSPLFAVEKVDKSPWDRFIDLLDSIPGFVIYGLFVTPVLLFLMPYALVMAVVLGLFLVAAVPLALKSYLQDRKLLRELRAAGRTLDGAEGVARLLRGEGTLIIGGRFGGGGWWYTADRVDIVQQMNYEQWAALDDEVMLEIYSKYQRDYFGPKGNALLLEKPLDIHALLREDGEFKEPVRWVEVFSSPSKSRSRYRRRSQDQLR